MTRIIMVISLVFLVLFSVTLFAQELPTPSTVANTVTNLWICQNFTGLNSYVTNLYASAPNYAPAILASIFHDIIFLGKMSRATDKIARVQRCVANNPQGYTKEFKDLLGELQSETKREVAIHNRMGTSSVALESNASPHAVRSTWGTMLPPQINILFYAPATNVP